MLATDGEVGHGHVRGRPVAAIQRAKNLNHWSRGWKISLIEGVDPNWHDLYDGIAR